MIPLLDWFLEMIGKSCCKMLAEISGEILFCGCFHGSYSTVSWAINFLKKYGDEQQIQRELKGTYKMLSIDCNLLLMLCYLNCDTETVKLLMESGFPEEKLLEKYCDKNALYYAIWCGNMDLVKYLLEDPGRKTLFTSEGAICENMSPIEFAKSVEMPEVAELEILLQTDA